MVCCSSDIKQCYLYRSNVYKVYRHKCTLVLWNSTKGRLHRWYSRWNIARLRSDLYRRAGLDESYCIHTWLEMCGWRRYTLIGIHIHTHLYTHICTHIHSYTLIHTHTHLYTLDLKCVGDEGIYITYYISSLPSIHTLYLRPLQPYHLQPYPLSYPTLPSRIGTMCSRRNDL